MEGETGVPSSDTLNRQSGNHLERHEEETQSTCISNGDMQPVTNMFGTALWDWHGSGPERAAHTSPDGGLFRGQMPQLPHGPEFVPPAAAYAEREADSIHMPVGHTSNRVREAQGEAGEEIISDHFDLDLYVEDLLGSNDGVLNDVHIDGLSDIQPQSDRDTTSNGSDFDLHSEGSVISDDSHTSNEEETNSVAKFDVGSGPKATLNGLFTNEYLVGRLELVDNNYADSCVECSGPDLAPAGIGGYGLEPTGVAATPAGGVHNDRGVEPIAIIGMSMRLPGGIRDSEALWDLLINGKSGRGKVPADRYNVDAFYGQGKARHICTKQGYFLTDVDLAQMDSSFWSMTKAEAEVMDPQQRLLLEVVYECLENSGSKGWRDRDIGCYVGVFGEDWLDLQSRDALNTGVYRILGYSDFAIANRVSYEFGFTGPSMTIRTACSSSLTGLHEACQALRSGECSSAIVGGSNIILSPFMSIGMTELGSLSPTGSCKSFDAAADGYARGEAVNAIHIKKLSDAVRDGDPIRAVIRSTCVNSDGKTAGLTLPNPQSHETLIRRSHELAGITDYSKTAMIECHGTGTPAGDPLEATAVANVFGQHGILIGSVKPNLGHAEGASGITSILKMVLALEKQVIPPNINFNKWNPRIPYREGRLDVPLQPVPLPRDRQRVGVNSFGISGANAHVLIDSAMSMGCGSAREGVDHASQPRLLVFSASNSESLRRRIRDLESYLSNHPGAVHDLAYTLCTRREPLTHRAFCLSDGSVPFQVPQFRQATQAPTIVFVFTGQGAQWPQMGKDLINENADFRETIKELDRVLQELEDGPPWSLRDEILKPGNTSNIRTAEYSQPCCTAIQIAMVKLLAKWNVRPGAVVGHSSGEIAAAFACGALTSSEAIKAAYYRGKVTRGAVKSSRGGMAAVSLGRDEVLPHLAPGVSIGCENSSNSVTLTGDVDVLDDVIEVIQSAMPETLAGKLRVDCAYHSSHMKAVEQEYFDLLKDIIVPKEPVVPFFSSVYGKKRTDEPAFSASYWCENLVSPVLFHTAVNAVLDSFPSKPLLLEVGPHSALAVPVRQIIRDHANEAEYMHTMVRNGRADHDLLRTAGQLFQMKVNLDFSSITAPGNVLTDLPTYPWHYEGRYWSESRVSAAWRLRPFPHHDILGSRVIESTDVSPAWRNMLRLDDVPWIQDHVVSGDIVFPGAGYVAMAGEAIRQLTGSCDYTVRHVDITNAMVLHDGKSLEVITQFSPSRLTSTLDSEWYDFSISSLNGATWVKHCAGQARGGSEYETPVPTIEQLPRVVSSNAWYKVMKHFGLNYGPRFIGLSDISTPVSSSEAVGTISDHVAANESPYQIHPCTIDVAFQLFSVSTFQGLPRLFNKLAVPTYIEELSIGKPRGDIVVRAKTETSPNGSFFGDAVGVSDGSVVFRLKNLRFSALTDDGDGQGHDPHAAAELEWRPDLNFIDAAKLMRPIRDVTEAHLQVERFALACMVETESRLQGRAPSQSHLEKFRSWLSDMKQKAIEGQYALVPDCAAIASMSSPERLQLIQDLHVQVAATEAESVATACHRIFENCTGIMDGATDPLEVLVRGDVLTGIYNFGQLWDHGDFIELAAHYKPNMRILEIGAGTGGMTSTILPHLKSHYGERMYFSYTYTDVSAGFFIPAKERFKDYEALEFAVLDITQDPQEQGFKAGSFDLVIASNVLHATPRLNDTLRNVRTLLHPQGRLLLQELCPETKWINFIMGVLPGWWLGEEDGRAGEPYVSPERWDSELKKAGFLGTDAVAFDHQVNANIVALPDPVWQSASSPEITKRRLTVLYGGQSDEPVEQVRTELQKKGFETDLCTLGDTPPVKQDIISLLDLKEPFLCAATAEQFHSFKEFLNKIVQSGVIWVTGAIQISCRDPRYSTALGMARTIRTELSIDFATLELEHFDHKGWSAVANVASAFRNRYRDDNVDPVLEYVYADEKIQVGRYHWISVGNELKEIESDRRARKLGIDKRGVMQTLFWQPAPLVATCEDWVEIDVKAVGVNFKVCIIP